MLYARVCVCEDNEAQLVPTAPLQKKNFESTVYPIGKKITYKEKHQQS